MRRYFLWPALIASVTALPSCKLVAAPFHLVGAVADGTYEVGKKAVSGPMDAYDRRQEKKEAEKAKKEKEEEKAKAKQEQPQPQGGSALFPDVPPTTPQPTPLPLPPANETTPLPPIAPPE